jgi:hypothetical protein
VPTLLATLALLPPGKTLAGPPEGASGKMVLDEVADGLRKYRRALTPTAKVMWLKRLAPSRDPRFVIALYNAHIDDAEHGDVQSAAFWILADQFLKGTRFQKGDIFYSGDWWKENETDLRRRAAQLPR